MSKRFTLKRFLGLTDEEIAENERLWAEEKGESIPVHTDSAGELRSAGLSQAGIDADIDASAPEAAPEDMVPPEPGAGAGAAMPASTGAPSAPPPPAA
jgi:hypothetical protein